MGEGYGESNRQAYQPTGGWPKSFSPNPRIGRSSFRIFRTPFAKTLSKNSDNTTAWNAANGCLLKKGPADAEASRDDERQIFQERKGRRQERKRIRKEERAR